MKKLSPHIKAAIKQFSYWMAAGTLGRDSLLKDIAREDYLFIFDEPSACEAAFSIFMNNLELNGNEEVLNFREA